jgi:hypothetical protein
MRSLSNQTLTRTFGVVLVLMGARMPLPGGFLTIHRP